MKEDILNYIVCPICHSVLRLFDAILDEDEVVSGALACSVYDGHRFGIEGGIPRFTIPDGTVEQVKGSFSKKWKTFEEASFTQKVEDFRFKWYLDRFGFDGVSGLRDFMLEKSLILDAGCGVGWATNWFAQNTNGVVFGVDFSKSIDIAYKHYGGRKNIHFIQADIRHLPFSSASFDYISCDQVIHHLPYPEDVFGDLVGLLKPRGEVSIYVYKRKGPIREFTDDYIRSFTTKMGVDDCLDASRRITALGKALADLKAEIVVKEDIPVLGIKAGTYDVQRLIYWNFMKCFWDENGDFDQSVCVNFDWYHPKYAHRYTLDEFESWFGKRGIEILSKNVLDSGISIRGVKW